MHFIHSLHADYASLVLTVAYNLILGRHKWYGWIVAALNAIALILVGIDTGAYGLIPAKVFSLGIYAHNTKRWLKECMRHGH